MAEKIFQVCLTKTNGAGENFYTELDLPARPWVLLDALDKVRYREGDGLSLEVDTYYDCQELEPHLSADPLSLMELNDLAVRLSEMSDTQRIAFQGLLRMDEAKGEGAISLRRLRDLAASVDCCHVVREVRTPAQLGRFYGENGFVPEIESLPDSVFELLDFELIGRCAQQGEGGVFTDYGYVVQNSDLNTAPEVTNQFPSGPKYTVLLELSWGTICTPDFYSVNVEMPLHQRASMEILQALNPPPGRERRWKCLDCRAPELAGLIEGSFDFPAVEALASELEKLNHSELALYRAVLSATNCTEISQAFELRNQLDQYILAPEISTPEDQARAELALMLPKSEAQAVASHLNLYAYGRELMEKNNSVQTDYGLLERRDGQPTQAMAEPHLEMEGMQF